MVFDFDSLMHDPTICIHIISVITGIIMHLYFIHMLHSMIHCSAWVPVFHNHCDALIYILWSIAISFGYPVYELGLFILVL